MELNFPKLEKEILDFWQKNKVFEKLRKKNQKNKNWSFLDGPITANNPMGVHHAWGRTYKDLFQRYKAMQGFNQRFQNGFDCQGLWVEVEVEKELGFKSKKDIEKYGIAKFVNKCKERVKKYSNIQTEQSIRLGQWMDWPNSYYTMSDENNYAIWHFLKKCWQLGYLYKGRDSIPWCPRCETAISQHEILTEEYKEVSHQSVYFLLPILDKKFKDVSFLVWTTTPWTIPANSALAINPEFEYGLYEGQLQTNKKNKVKKIKLIILKELAEKVLGSNFVLKKAFKGRDLKGLKYQSPFDDLIRVKEAKEQNLKTFHTVVLDKDLVLADEGTGIIHIAPGAGQEDFKLGLREKLVVVDVINENAVYLDKMSEFSSKNAKKNPEIILDYLEKLDSGKFFFKKELYTHRYPTCWRCKEELVWRAVDEWYISMEKLRKPLMDITKKIKWLPSFGLERELDWLKNMQDWLISKKRYWGLALPIFECPKCKNFEVIGSKKELEEKAVEGWPEFLSHSPHRPWVDKIKIKCSKCGQKVTRIKDVGNPWLDAGIVPFSTLKYFEDKKIWKSWFPVEFICESFPGQFKNWFYSLLVMSAVLEKNLPVKVIFGYGSVKDEKGEEMHKSKGNAIWFDEAVEKIGAEPMRWLYGGQNPALNLFFGYNVAKEVQRKLLILWNSFVFFQIYIDKKDFKFKTDYFKSKNILDKWIISRLNGLIEKATKALNSYDAALASQSLEKFFTDDLSLWYIRRSRRRFRSDNEKNKEEAINTFYFVLLNLIKLLAPFVPFLSEKIYQDLKTKQMPISVHLNNWPEFDKKLISIALEDKISRVREIVTLALAERAKAGIKVRQPLSELTIIDSDLKKEADLLDLIKEEVNVKKISFGKNLKLNLEITSALKEEGIIREIVRHIQEMRKTACLKPEHKILVKAFGSEEINKILIKNKKLIVEEIKANDFELEKELKEKFTIEKQLKIENWELKLAIKKL